MRYLSSLSFVTNKSLSTVHCAVVSVAAALLFPTALFAASSLPATIPTSVPVTVTNTPLSVTAASPLAVVSDDAAVKNAFQETLVFQGTAGPECMVVPTGKRAVVEFASARFLVQSGFPVEVTLFSNFGGKPTFHRLSLNKRGSTSGLDLFAGGTAMRMYADPDPSGQGHGVCIGASALGNVLPANLEATVSGYFVNMR